MVVTSAASASGTNPTRHPSQITSGTVPVVSPTCTAGWNVVPSPDEGSNGDNLEAVSAVSPNDVWAVGYYFNQNGIYQAETQHWDGAQWSIIPSPGPGYVLYAVSALTSNDVWAVGYVGASGSRTITEHWDGTQWNLVPSPDTGAVNSYLYSVVAISHDDAWAVGYTTNAEHNQYGLLIDHWDGAQWSLVPVPNPGVDTNWLFGVDAISANDVWAVGFYGENGVSSHSLTLHWDGAQWNLVPTPDLPGSRHLIGVSARASNDVWAVTGAPTPQSIHWDGTQWTYFPMPQGPHPGYTYLTGVKATGPNDAWAIGNYTLYGENDMQLEHWDGTQWSLVPSPAPPSPGNTQLNGIDATSSNDVWAVGYYGVAYQRQHTLTLALHKLLRHRHSHPHFHEHSFRYPNYAICPHRACHHGRA